MSGGRSQESQTSRRASRDGSYDLDRLEGAIESLLTSYERLHAENASLRKQLDERVAQIRELDDRLLQQNQRRHDALKRIDDLVARLDHLDGHFERVEQERGAEDAPA